MELYCVRFFVAEPFAEVLFLTLRRLNLACFFCSSVYPSRSINSFKCFKSTYANSRSVIVFIDCGGFCRSFSRCAASQPEYSMAGTLSKSSAAATFSRFIRTFGLYGTIAPPTEAAPAPAPPPHVFGSLRFVGLDRPPEARGEGFCRRDCFASSISNCRRGENRAPAVGKTDSRDRGFSPWKSEAFSVKAIGPGAPPEGGPMYSDSIVGLGAEPMSSMLSSPSTSIPTTTSSPTGDGGISESMSSGKSPSGSIPKSTPSSERDGVMRMDGDRPSGNVGSMASAE
mmetsp:Transcript_60606/g.84288  ORF Transcript_60606/g.84288 Transcript_60606/m.84288 type:complete len:284 (-) Transcript_60606:298-1149(-)